VLQRLRDLQGGARCAEFDVDRSARGERGLAQVAKRADWIAPENLGPPWVRLRQPHQVSGVAGHAHEPALLRCTAVGGDIDCGRRGARSGAL
jgi:hypothetical protein